MADPEFIGRNDGQGRQNALSQLHLAREHTHPTGLREIEPLRQLPVGVQIAGQYRTTVIAVKGKPSRGRCRH
jgi:hypothetical protein